MAINVYKSKTGVQRIGINVASANQVAGSYQSIANTFAQNTNNFFREAADRAKKRGQDIAMSTPVESIIGIDPKTGQPESYKLPDGFGTIAVEAFRNVIDQRFYKSIEDDYKIKAKELADKNPLSLSNFQQSFIDYTSKVVDNAEGKFKEFARNISENQLKAYSASINNNIISYNLAKAKAHSNEEDNELLEVAYVMGLNPEAKSNNTETYSDFPQKQFYDYLKGWESNKEAQIAIGATTVKATAETKRAATHEFLRGKLLNILQKDRFANRKLEARRFQTSIRLLRPNKALGQDAYDFVLALKTVGVTANDLKNLDTLMNAESTIKQEHRDKIKEDEAARLKVENDLYEKNEKETNRIENIDRIDIKQNLIAKRLEAATTLLNGGSFTDWATTNAFLDQTKQDVKKLQYDSDNPLNQTEANQLYTQIEDARLDHGGRAFSTIIRNVALSVVGKSSEIQKDVRSHLEDVFNGANPNISKLGEQSHDRIMEIRSIIPNFRNFKNFAIGSSLNTFDNEIEKTNNLEIETKKIQEKELEAERIQQSKQNFINFIDAVNKDKRKLINNLSNGIELGENDVTNLIKNIDGAFTNGVITKDNRSKLINDIRTDVGSKLLANHIKLFSVGSNIPNALDNIKKLQEYIMNPDKDIDLPDEFKNIYLDLQSKFNFDNSQMSSYFNKLLTFYKQDIESYSKKFSDQVLLMELVSGVRKNQNSDNVNKALLTANGTINQAGELVPADEQEYYSSEARVNDIPLYGMVSNNNVPSGLTRTLERIAEGNITIDPDNSPIFQFLINLRNFPLDQTGEMQDITPLSFYENPKISKLMNVLTIAQMSGRTGIGDFNTTMQNVNDNLGNVQPILENIFPGGFLDNAYSIAKTPQEKQSFVDRKIRDVLDLGIRFNRGSNPKFFKILDSELPVMIASGLIKNEDDFNNYITERFKENMELSNEVFDNANSIQENNFTPHGLKRAIPSEDVRNEVVDELIFTKIIPFWQNFYADIEADKDARGDLDVDTSFEPSPPVPENVDGFKIKFGNKTFLSQPNATDENMIEIRLTPRVDMGSGPEEIIMETEQGLSYRGLSLMDQMMNGYNVYFRRGNMNNFIPMSNQKFESDLDVYTEHHYKNIANGEFVQNQDNSISTVMASTFEIGEGETRTFILLPLVFDGRIYPTETIEDKNALFERATRDRPLTDYLMAESELELNSVYHEDIKSKWEDIGTDASNASILLDQSKFKYNDVMSVDIFGLANKYYRIAAEEQYKNHVAEYLFRHGVDTMEEADKFLTEKVINRAKSIYAKRRALKDYPISELGIKGMTRTGDLLLPETEDSFMLPEMTITKEKLLNDLFDNNTFKILRDYK